jgi:hypothetical protein
VRLGWHWRTAVRLKGESWGRKGGRASPAIAVSAPARAAPLPTRGREAPISQAAHEAFQLPTNKGDHAIDASFCPLDGIFCPHIAATAMKDGL